MLTDQKKGPEMIGLLPTVSMLWPPEPRICNAPPIVGGFQMPLPGLSGSCSEIEDERPFDWHCYLGSK